MLPEMYKFSTQILRVCKKSLKSKIKNALGGLPWWSSSEEFALPIQGMHVRFLVKEVRSHVSQDISPHVTTKTQHSQINKF